MNAMTIKQAAKYLNKHEQTLEYYQRKGWLKEDYTYGDNEDRMYSQETLDASRQKYLNAQGLTMSEIASRYGRTELLCITTCASWVRQSLPASARGNTFSMKLMLSELRRNSAGRYSTVLSSSLLVIVTPSRFNPFTIRDTVCTDPVV